MSDVCGEIEVANVIKIIDNHSIRYCMVSACGKQLERFDTGEPLE